MQVRFLEQITNELFFLNYIDQYYLPTQILISDQILVALNISAYVNILNAEQLKGKHVNSLTGTKEDYMTLVSLWIIWLKKVEKDGVAQTQMNSIIMSLDRNKRVLTIAKEI